MSKNNIVPEISVLIPVYRPKEAYLRECIESILVQTFENFELLLLDDCPEDRSAEAIIQSYHDSRIKYSRNERNLGISQSRNKLIEMARGKYLAVMDHDDIALPERFAKEAAYLDAHPEVGVVSGKVLRFPKNKTSGNPTDSHEIKLSLMTVCAMTHPAAMIRKSVLDEYRIRYEEDFSPSEDYALWCRLLPHTEFHNLSEVVLKYRCHESNTSLVQNDKMHKSAMAVRAFVQAENPALYNEFLRRAKSVAVWRLFGIPLLQITGEGERIRVKLFGILPFLSCKSSIKLKEK